MKASDILQTLNVPRIKQVARKLDVELTGTRKAEHIDNVTCFLARQKVGYGFRTGWKGELHLLVAVLANEDLVIVIGDTVWEGTQNSYQVMMSAFRRLPVTEKRKILLELALAEKSSSRKNIDRICSEGRYAECFQTIFSGEAVSEKDEDEVVLSCPSRTIVGFGRSLLVEGLGSLTTNALRELLSINDVVASSNRKEDRIHALIDGLGEGKILFRSGIVDQLRTDELSLFCEMVGLDDSGKKKTKQERLSRWFRKEYPVEKSPVRSGPRRRPQKPNSSIEQKDSTEPSWQKSSLFRINPDGPLPVDGIERSHSPLFPHQVTAIDKMLEWLHRPGDKSGVLVLPTGAGKTRTAVSFLLEHLIPNSRVLWLAHRDELLNQAVATFLSLSHHTRAPFSLAQYRNGAKHRGRADVCVASIDTLKFERNGQLNNLEKLMAASGPFNYVVVDECHHGPAGGWSRLLQSLKGRPEKPRLLGLTATPTRIVDREKMKLWRLFDSIIHEVPVPDMIEDEILAIPSLHPVDTNREFEASPEDKKFFQQFKEISASLAKKIAADEARNSLVVKCFVEKKQFWGNTLLFAQSIGQANHLTSELQRNGVRAAAVFGDTDSETRKQVVEGFRDGKLEVVVNCNLFTEGTDIPNVNSVFLARVTRSTVLFSQMVGRGMRGPRIGGTRKCHVVTFNDSISGLMDDYLTKPWKHDRPKEPWKKESDLFQTMGWPVPSAVGENEALEKEASDQRVREDKDTYKKEVRRIIEYLRSLQSGQETTVPEEIPLLGWWKCELQGTLYYLPVFKEDNTVVQTWITQLIISLGTREEAPQIEDIGELYWASPKTCSNFAEVVLKANLASHATPNYVQIDQLVCQPGDDEEVCRQLQGEAGSFAQALEMDDNALLVSQSTLLSPPATAATPVEQEPSRKPRWELAASLVQLGYAVAYADRELHELEEKAIEDGLLSIDAALGIPEATGGVKMLMQMSRKPDQDHEAALAGIVEQFAEMERTSGFDFALNVAIADGKLTSEEREILYAIGRRLGVSAETVDDRLRKYGDLDLFQARQSDPGFFLCRKCGARSPDEFKFCGHCGAVLGGRSDVPILEQLSESPTTSS